jgi:L-alanine-DL-glutamate epimerase-like enolase superfamily enzyme
MGERDPAAKVRNRRDFLNASALGIGLTAAAGSLAADRSTQGATRSAAGGDGRNTALGAGLKIVRVQAFPLSYPGEFAYGSVRKPNQEAGTYFEVETANGLIGHGITAISDPRAVANLTNQLVAPTVVGQNAMDHEAIWSKLYWQLTPRGQTGLATHAISGVDIALWDLKGKALGVPIASLLGGARKEVPLYVTFGPAFLSRDELVDVAKAMTAQGFKHLKMVVGQGALERRDTRPLTTVVEEDVARVRAVREAVGADVNLYIDGNCNFDFPTAERLVRGLEPHRISFFEEPLMQNDVRLMADLRRRTGVTLAAGQNEGMAFRFRDMMIAEAVDYVQPNVMITGGFTQTVKIAGMASAFNVAIANGGAGALQNMHVHAGLWNGGFCEWHLPFMGLCRHIYRDMPEARDGKVSIPAAPGLGFEPNRDVIRAITLKS